MTEEIHSHCHGGVGHISLNRPKAIHSLTLGMCEGMIAALSGWSSDDNVKAVIVDHGEGRGFCAGGDINLLRTSALEDGGKLGRKFFFEEYRLNHQMFTYAKPIVAFMDGVTMGGGVGISQPARFRVATENTRFAMPESGIGLFPDVGGGWYLSRLKGRLGQYLALTGARLDGADCLWAGLATHYLPSEKLAEAKARIIAEPENIEGVLIDLSGDAPESKIAAQSGDIDRLFAAEKLEDIIAALKADGGEWAAKQMAILATKSPTTCKVSLRQLSESASLETFADNMRMEYRLGSRILLKPDFAEGVRALIVDKTNDPKWDPATPEAVTSEAVDALFAPLPPEEEWSPL